MEGHFSTGQSLQWAVVPMEEEEALPRATRHVPMRFAKCIDVDSGIFENVLY